MQIESSKAKKISHSIVTDFVVFFAVEFSYGAKFTCGSKESTVYGKNM